MPGGGSEGESGEPGQSVMLSLDVGSLMSFDPRGDLHGICQ